MRLIGGALLGGVVAAWKPASLKAQTCSPPCKKNKICCTTGTSPFCTDDGKFCCGNTSCPNGHICCTTSASPFCINPSQTCCGSTSCKKGETCCNNTACCSAKQVCVKGQCQASKGKK